MSNDRDRREHQDAIFEYRAAKRQAVRDRHSELLLAAIRCEAQGDRLDDHALRAYIVEITSHLDLPQRPVPERNRGHLVPIPSDRPAA